MSVSGVSNSSAAWELLEQQRAAASDGSADATASGDLANATPLNEATPVGGGGGVVEFSPQLFEVLGSLQSGQAASSDPAAGTEISAPTAASGSATDLTATSLAADATTLMGELQSFIAQLQPDGTDATGTRAASISTSTTMTSLGTAAHANGTGQAATPPAHHHHVAKALDSYGRHSCATDITEVVGAQTSVTA